MPTIFVFLLILSILILVHEFGHFLVAKKAGIKVEEFGLGFPPRLFAKKIGETTYSVNALLFGGFVKLYGEDEPQQEDRQRSFFDKPKKIRATVLLGGVLMNFLLAVFSFTLLYGFLGFPKKVGYVKVIGVAQESPAASSGLIEGDIIQKVEDHDISGTSQFINLIEEKKGREISLVIDRGGKSMVIKVVPRISPPKGEGPLGVIITDSEIYFPPLWQRPFLAAYFGVKEAVFWAGTTFLGVKGVLIQFFSQGSIPKDVAGPVGIFQITGEVAKSGIFSLINLLGLLSVNLAILNILPFPALDGGRLLFVGLETVFGRRVLPKAERIVHAIGMALLLIFLLAVTVQDISRLIDGQNASFLKRFFSPY